MLRKLYRNFEEYLCVTFCAVMVICLTLQVVMRTLTGDSIAWTEELSRYSFIWTVYMAMCLATKRLAQVRITAQFLKASVPVRIFFRVISDIICIVFNIFIIWVCVRSIRENLEFPEISPTLGVVKAYIEMIIPFCFALASWRCIECYITHIREGSLDEMVMHSGEGEGL